MSDMLQELIQIRQETGLGVADAKEEYYRRHPERRPTPPRSMTAAEAKVILADEAPAIIAGLSERAEGDLTPFQELRLRRLAEDLLELRNLITGGVDA
jgi:hypothetical protein